MIPLPPIVYLAIFTLLTVGFGGLQTHRLHASEKAYGAFVAEVKAKGEEAEKRAQETIKRDQKAKENADAQNVRLRASNAALSRSLLDARSSRGYVPAAPANARSPQLACYSRPDLERALREFDAEVAGIVQEGDSARIDLDSARSWAQAR